MINSGVSVWPTTPRTPATLMRRNVRSAACIERADDRQRVGVRPMDSRCCSRASVLLLPKVFAARNDFEQHPSPCPLPSEGEETASRCRDVTCTFPRPPPPPLPPPPGEEEGTSRGCRCLSPPPPRPGGGREEGGGGGGGGSWVAST